MSEGLQLVMSQGPTPGRAFTIDRASLTIGRDPSVEIAINEPQVSRLHARVSSREGVLVLEDLGSTNGTFVNGVRLTGSQVLTPGDVIGLGEAVTLTYYSSGAVSTATMGAAPPAPGLARGVPAPRPETPGPAPYVASSAGAGRAPIAPAAEPPAYEEGAGEGVDGEDEQEKKRRKALLIGCGCLALVLACLAVALFLWYAPTAFWEFLIGLGIPIPSNPF